MKNIYNPSSEMLGNYTEYDGTIRFYTRISRLINSDSAVLDFGAGRARWFYDDDCQYRREIRDIKKIVKEFIAADIDPEVLNNPTTTKNLLIKENKIDLADGSIDLIIADYVLEHVENPTHFYNEVDRL